MTLRPPEFWTRSGFRRAHRIDVYEKATLVQRDLRSGSWLIEGIPSNSEAAADLEAGGGMIAFFGQHVLDSGRVEMIDEFESFDDASEQFVSSKSVGGSLDLAFVEDRKAVPSPSTLNFAAEESHAYAGAAETALKEAVDDNLGPSAHTTRVQTDFAIAPDLGRGSAITDEVRFTPFAELLAGWSVVGGIIPICRVDDGQLVFDVYEPVDLTDTITFSLARSNVVRIRRSEQAPDLTFEWVGGQGDGTARTFVSGGDTTVQSRWGFRRETMRDRRDTNDLAVLGQQLDEDLATHTGLLTVEVDPLDIAPAQYGIDYQLGDIVSAITVGGIVVARQIREVRIECTPDDVVTFRPLLADPLTPSPEDLVMFSDVRDLSSRLVTQEAH